MTDEQARKLPWWWVQTPGTSGHVIDYLHLEPHEPHEPHECRELLDALRAAVPTRRVHDGGRYRDVHLHPNEIEEPHLKAAAIELEWGELEHIAVGEDEPECEMELWERLLSEVNDAIGIIETFPKIDRADGVSIASLLEAARGNLEGIRFATAFAHQNARDDEEKDFVRSVQAETALHVFWLGWRMRALDQKPFDEAARTGLKVRAGAKLGGEMNQSPRPESIAVLEAMDEALRAQAKSGKKENLKSAATIARRKGLGTSVAANEKLFRRRLKK